MAQATARPRFSLKLTKLDFLSLVDVPAQATADIRLIKRDDPDSLVAKIVRVDESSSDPLIWAWAFTSTLPDGTVHHDRQDDAITPDFIRVAEEFIKAGGAVDELHDGQARDSRIAFAFPWSPEIATAMLGPEAAAANKTTGLMVAIRPTAEQLAKAKSGEFGGVSIAGTGLREALKAASQPKCANCNAYGKSTDENCASCGKAMKSASSATPPIAKTIREEDGKFVLYSQDGEKKLGTHDTKADAEAQEQAIEANKRADVTKYSPDQARDHGQFASGGGGGGGGLRGGSAKSEYEHAAGDAESDSAKARSENTARTHAVAASAHSVAANRAQIAGDRAAGLMHTRLSSNHASMASMHADHTKALADHEDAAVAHRQAADAADEHFNATRADGGKPDRAADEKILNLSSFHVKAGSDQARTARAIRAGGADRKPRTKKRASDYVAKRAVLTSSDDGHQHQLDLDDPADQWFGDKLRTTDAVLDGADNPHSHDWVFDAVTGVITIAESAGHSHTVSSSVPTDVLAQAALNESGEQCPRCGKMCSEDASYCQNCGCAMGSDGAPKAAMPDEDSKSTPAVVVISARAPDTTQEPISPPAEATPTVDITKEHEPMATDALQILTDKHDKLEKRNVFLEKFALLTDAERAHYNSLVGQDKDVFLEKSPLARQVEISEIAKADEIIYTSPVDGEVFRKSSNPRELKVKKQADEATIELRLQKQRAADLELAQKGAQVFTHIAKGARGNIPGRLMKAINAEFTDQTEYEEVIEALKGLNNAMKETLSTAKGVTPNIDASPQAPESQLDALAKRHAADNKVTYPKAYDAILNTAEGQRLYSQISTARA